MNVMLYSHSYCFYTIIKADTVERKFIKFLMSEIILCLREKKPLFKVNENVVIIKINSILSPFSRNNS